MKQTARETIDQLLEVLTAAVAETQREPDGWKADACAGNDPEGAEFRAAVFGSAAVCRLAS